MALINCKNCGAEISDKAKVCPKCGQSVNVDVTPAPICPECSEKIQEGAKVCPNCGYTLSSKRKIKKFAILGSVALVVVLIIVIVIAILGKNNNAYIVDACKEIQKNLSNPNSLSLQEVYISDEESTDTTIDYVYRVYIVYRYTNSYDSKKEGTVLYVIDDKGKTYFIEDSSSEQLYAYKSIAEMEIFGLSGWFEPSDNWIELEGSEVNKIEKKID